MLKFDVGDTVSCINIWYHTGYVEKRVTGFVISHALEDFSRGTQYRDRWRLYELDSICQTGFMPDFNIVETKKVLCEKTRKAFIDL